MIASKATRMNTLFSTIWNRIVPEIRGKIILIVDNGDTHIVRRPESPMVMAANPACRV